MGMDLSPFGPFLHAPEQGKPENSIRLAGGTPLDSGRFRQTVNIRKKECADAYCRLDCQNLHTVCRHDCPGRSDVCGRGMLLHRPSF